MSVRSRIAEPPSVEVAKVFGPGTPASFRQGEEAAQMTPASPFSPGTPIGPYDGYDRVPRERDFVTGYNIATRPRTHERVSFETLKGLVEAYDVAQICIWHRIDSIRALDWKLVAAEGYSGDVSDAIEIGMAALKKPDRENDFDTWLAKYLYDLLAYDAACLYRLRNRAGRAVGLMPVDGTTIAPLLDYWGRSPQDGAEAYVQYANGLPWGWLTRDDLIYEPFRPRTNSPYGTAPLESIILNANTDLRFQVYFLQRFTEGNLPAAFASAPESWSPEQITQFQELWDSFMYSDQSRKHQIRWMPPGSKFEWTNEKDFTDTFSLFMMRKSCAAYHTVPSDLGFTEDVNRSSGESQADVQHKVGELPLVRKVQRVITGFVQDDLGLPLRHAFDIGEEQDDRLATAQSDDIYAKIGVIGVSELREMRFGKSEPAGKPVPRFIFSNRAGAIPLSALEDVAGPVDDATGAPAPGAELPHKEFAPIEGVVPVPPPKVPGLAEREYGPSALLEAPPQQPVAKEGEAAPGITSETGIYGDPLIRDGEDEEVVSHHFITEDEARQAYRESVAKELSAFRRFERTRRKSGEWRDFRFTAADPVTAHNLNDAGRLAVRKAAGEIAVAGLAVLAADTGRVLMLQRALCDDDPAAGKLEFPGGHLDGTETPLQAAWREFCEETGCPAPPGSQTGTWTSPNGIYQGIVWTTGTEASVPVRGEAFIPNPDDPDGDSVEAVMWVAPTDLPSNPMLRTELAADLDAVMAALGCTPGCCGGVCCQGDGGCCGGSGGCQCGTVASDAEQVIKAYPDGQSYGSHAFRADGDSPCCWYCGMARIDPFHQDYPDGVAKSADADPKDGSWPGWKLDLQAVAYWAPLLAAALSGALSKAQAERIARAYLADHPAGEQGDTGKREAVEAAAGWLASQGIDLAPAIAPLVPGMLADAWLTGGASAQAMTGGGAADTAGWQPGDTDPARDRAEALGLGSGLSSALGQAQETASQMAAGYMTALGRALVDGAAAGLGAAGIAASLLAALSDPDHASGSVLGRLVIGIGAAALALYLLRKVQRVRWVTDPASNVCPECLANEAASPYKITNAPGCPAHPECRCAVVPA